MKNLHSNLPLIFIGGFFKSGTTLLRAMIGQHSAIAAGLETYWFDMDWKNRGDKFLERLHLLQEFYNIKEDVMLSIVEESTDAEDFLNNFLGYYSQSIGKKTWAEKTPGNITQLDRIFTRWPHAKFIHIIRDPRDVLASLRQNKKRDSVEEFSTLWSRFIGNAEEWKKKQGEYADKFLEVRYEKLVLIPHEVTEQIFLFLGIDWEDQVSYFEGKKEEHGMVLKLTGKDSITLRRVQEPLTKKRIGIWEDTLEVEELERVRSRLVDSGVGEVWDRIIAESEQAENGFG